MENNSHLIICYKGDISALVLFCQQQEGDICFPPLPKLSSIVEEQDRVMQSIDLYPTQLIKKLNAQLDLDDDLLVAEPGFYEQVETPKGIVTVYMARFKLLDPPHELMLQRHCKMQNLTALRGGSPAEMALLRKAYSHFMGD